MIIVFFSFYIKFEYAHCSILFRLHKSLRSLTRGFYIIAAVSGVIVVALVLIAILVGMYLFTEAEKEIIQARRYLELHFHVSLERSD